MTDVKMPKPVIRDMEPYCEPTGFTEAQMKQYGDDRAREALEKAAKVVEADLWPGPIHDYQNDYNDGVKSLAKKVLALAKEIK